MAFPSGICGTGRRAAGHLLTEIGAYFNDAGIGWHGNAASPRIAESVQGRWIMPEESRQPLATGGPSRNLRKSILIWVVLGSLLVGVGTWYTIALIQEKRDLEDKIAAQVGFLQQYIDILPAEQKPKVMLVFAQVLRQEYRQRQYDRIYQATELLGRIYHDNGHLAYYQGEIWRARNNSPEMRKSFLRYLDMESNQPEPDRSGDGEVCYNLRPEGFCGERTAWICHLLAGEYYDQAIHTNGVEKKTYLEQAAKYVECEIKRFPGGFIQNDPPKVIPTEVLRSDVEQQLKELKVNNQR